VDPITAQELLDAVKGRLVGPLPAGPVTGISTDSRRIHPGEAFFAIRGQRFDGHDYIGAAFAGGAAVAVISRQDLLPTARQENRPVILTDDTVAALGRLATWYRSNLPARVVAITGSNGKTTTKAMLEAVLSRQAKTLAAPQSFNNQLGVPLTLLSARREHDYMIVELGTNRPGEIAQLGRIAQPDLAVITSIGPAHTEGLGGLDAIAREKASLLEYLPAGGFAAVNIDEPAIGPYLQAFAGTLVRFGTGPQADLRAESIAHHAGQLQFRVNGKWPVRLPIRGRHNALNALGAWAIATRLGLPPEQIAEALAAFEPPKMRLQVLRFGPITVLNDAYNANPASVAAALQTLAEMPAPPGRRRVAVLGDMLELGPNGPAMHERTGRLLAELERIDCLIAVGSLAEHIADAAHAARPELSVHRFGDAAEACRGIAELLRGDDTILLKGSRAMRMEQLLDPIANVGRSASAASR